MAGRSLDKHGPGVQTLAVSPGALKNVGLKLSVFQVQSQMQTLGPPYIICDLGRVMEELLILFKISLKYSLKCFCSEYILIVFKKKKDFTPSQRPLQRQPWRFSEGNKPTQTDTVVFLFFTFNINDVMQDVFCSVCFFT